MFGFLILLSQFSFNLWSYDYSLEKLGYKDGITIQKQLQNIEVYFPLPLNSKIAKGYLTLNLEYSPLLKEPSELKVALNGINKSHTSLASKSSDSIDSLMEKTIRIPVTEKDLKNNFLKIQLSFFNSVHSDPCLNQELASGVVRLKETSNLNLEFEADDNLDSFLLNQKKNLLIYSSLKNLTESQYQNLIKLLSLLDSFHLEANWTSQMNEAQIVIDNNEAFYRINKGQLFYSLDSQNEIDSKILALYPNQEKNSDIKTLKSSSLLLRDELGLSSKGLKTSNGVEWNFKFDPKFQVELNSPSALHLSLIAPQHNSNKTTTHLSVFLNEELVKTIILDNSEGPQYHRIEFPSYLKRYPFDVKITIKESGVRKACSTEIGKEYDHQLLADTALELQPVTGKPKNFAEFSLYSRGGIEVLVEKKTFSQTINDIKRLVFVTKMFSLSPRQFNISFSKEASSSPFIKLSQEKALGELSFKGLYRVNLGGKNNLGAIELVERNGQIGLIYNTLSDFIPSFYPPEADLNKLLVFSEDKLTLLTNTSSLMDQVPHISMADRIIPFLQRWRFYLMALTWLLLTFVFIRLGKKLRK